MRKPWICEEAGESLREAIALANFCHIKKLVYINTKKPLVIQRLLMINWMFLVVFKRSLIYEFSLLTCYTSLHHRR
ncbi:MAG: hypothetical protein V7L09_01230 [Nostoc sp.]|uniref:hypothetical protein n=1 Tax=Nostoc sp. TaxID=1180 RepID=UPI002FF15F35